MEKKINKFYETDEIWEDIIQMNENIYETLIDDEEYIKILSSMKNDFSYILLDIIKNIYSIDEFNKLSNDDLFIYFIKNTKEKNLKNIVDLYNITSWEEFELIYNNELLRNLLEFAKEENLEFIIRIFNNVEDFQKIYKNTYMVNVLKNSKEENFRYVIKLYELELLQNPDNFYVSNNVLNILKYSDLHKLKYIIDLCNNSQDFENICNNENLMEVLNLWKEENIELLINLFDNLEELNYYLNNRKIVRILIFWKKNNIKLIMNLSNSLQEFSEICKNINILDIMQYTKEEYLEYIIYLYNIKNINELEDVFDNEIIFDIWEIAQAENINFLNQYRNHNLSYNINNYIKKRILVSQNNSQKFFTKNFPKYKNFSKLFEYYINNKQKSFFDLLEKIKFVEEYWLNINIDKFEIIENFENYWNIDFEELRKNFEKIIDLNQEKQKNKLLRKFDNFVKSKNFDWLKNFLAENLIKYFDRIYDKKLKIRIINELRKNLWWNINIWNIKKYKINDFDFIEAYKMSINPAYNKDQINSLLYNYLLWKFENIQDCKQYDTENNNKWLAENLTEEQQKIWLSSNREEISLDQEINDKSINNLNNLIEENYNNCINIINLINELWFNFKTNFDKYWQLLEYYNIHIKNCNKDIEKRDKQNLTQDLENQINLIKKLFKEKKWKNSKKIIIEKELNPIKCLMMWNVVDWSCMSFYFHESNYYSCISNTIDVNKWIFYIKNEKWNILWRCIITIWNDKKISRYKMWYSSNINEPIDKYFDDYTIKLSKKMWLKLNWDQNKVENIECDKWYKDWVKKIIE